jgi:hypothetical protein
MNGPRLFLAIVVALVFVAGSDWLMHVTWLQSYYHVMPSLWRDRPEMQSRCIFMIASQLLSVIAFLYIWARTGWRRRSVVDGCVFGFWMGAWQQAFTIALYVAMPLTLGLTAKVFLAGVGQGVVLGAIGALIYKPRSLTSRGS